MKNFRYIKSILCLAFVAMAFTGCEENLDGDLSNFVGFSIDAPKAIAVPSNATQSFDVSVYASESRSSDRTFAIMVDEASTLASPYSVPAQVTIPGGSNEGVLTISITDNDDLGFVPQDLLISFAGQDGVSNGEGLSISVAEECPGSIVTFNLNLDTWPDETSWEVFDLTGAPTVIFSGGPYVNPDDDFAELSFDFCLTPGNYGVVVYDSYGDGGPSYSVTSATGTLVSETTVGGAQSSSTFTVN